MTSNSGFLNHSSVVKVNSFIELVGTVNNDAGYEWFWQAGNNFKLKNVYTISYNDEDGTRTLGT
jgi:hypothetical protein